MRAKWLWVGFLFLVLLSITTAEQERLSLNGAIDLHCHSSPDTVARSLSSFEVVRQARAAEMRAIVLKNHFVSTAALAQLAMSEVGGIEVFGGIVLNRANGGLNPEAVRRMAQVEGHRGRIVWLPTFDAENQVKFTADRRPYVSIVRDGQLLPEFIELFKIIAADDLILATGHSSPAESLLVIDAAGRAGIKRLLITHVLSEPCRATIVQMKQMAALGATLEMTWLAHLGGPSGPVAGAPPMKPVPIEDCVRALREVGPSHFIISSDLGQANNPSHPEGLHAFMAALQQAGVTASDLDLLVRRNPARLLGLEP